MERKGKTTARTGAAVGDSPHIDAVVDNLAVAISRAVDEARKQAVD